MKIRIGDRVRVKRDWLWGTVVNKIDYAPYQISVYVIWLDEVGANYKTNEIEKLPRYRGYPQARDMETAMRHLQEYMR